MQALMFCDVRAGEYGDLAAGGLLLRPDPGAPKQAAGRGLHLRPGPGQQHKDRDPVPQSRERPGLLGLRGHQAGLRASSPLLLQLLPEDQAESGGNLACIDLDIAVKQQRSSKLMFNVLSFLLLEHYSRR